MTARAKKIPSWFWFVGLVALLLRLALIPNPGFEADISFWKSWGLAVVDQGAVAGLALTNNNYPTPFSYTLGFMVFLYKLFADPHNFDAFWQNTNVLFLFIAKIFPILADFGIAGLILWFPLSLRDRSDGAAISTNKQNMRLLHFVRNDNLRPLLASLYLLNPVSLIDGAWWGQVDSLGVFVFLVSCFLLLKRFPLLAGAVYMLSMMTKLQNMIYGPLFFLFAWQFGGFAGLIRTLGGSVLAFAGLNSEFILARQMGRVVESLVGNYDYFPWLSLNAFNPWWVVAGAKGMQVIDKIAIVGITNAKTVGLYLFSATYLLAALFMLLTPQHPTLKSKSDVDFVYRFLTALIIAAGGFFLFQTESHDRYAFPIIVFLLLWFPLYAKRFTIHALRIPYSLFLILYSLFSFVYFYNLHTALVFNYPYNGIPILSSLIQPQLTILASLLLTAMFFLFLFIVLRKTSPIVWIVPLVTCLLLLVSSNLPLITKKPISITKLTPMASSQDYGARQKNMPVNATFGYNNWSPLSVQYAFYKTGIGTHANSSHVYDINRQFSKFTTDVGIDTQAGSQGSATFEIYGDGKRLYASGNIGRFEFPRHADVDVRGVKVLELRTTDAGNGKTDDHTDWLNPKLYP